MLEKIITQLGLPQGTTEESALETIKGLHDQSALARQREESETKLADLMRVTGMSRAEALANLEHQRIGAEQNKAVEAGRVIEQKAVLERSRKRAAAIVAHIRAHSPEAVAHE